MRIQIRSDIKILIKFGRANHLKGAQLLEIITNKNTNNFRNAKMSLELYHKLMQDDLQDELEGALG